MAEIAAVLSNDETRAQFADKVATERKEAQVEAYIATLSEDQIEAAIKEAQEANEARRSHEEVVKVAADYKAAGAFIAEGFKEEMGLAFDKIAENAGKMDTIISLFGEAGFTL